MHLNLYIYYFSACEQKWFPFFRASSFSVYTDTCLFFISHLIQESKSQEFQANKFAQVHHCGSHNLHAVSLRCRD